jgi:hypothetical protein
MAEKYEVATWLPDNFAIQCEIYGPGIQGNPTNSPDVRIAVFDIYDIQERKYFSLYDVLDSCGAHEVPTAPLIDYGMAFQEPDEWQSLATKKSKIVDAYNGRSQEGVVVRLMRDPRPFDEFQRVSFKVINLEYKG